MSWKFAVILVTILGVCLMGCGNDNVMEVPNVDHIDVSVETRRFEREHQLDVQRFRQNWDGNPELLEQFDRILSGA